MSEELLKKIEELITNQGFKVSGNGIICENTKKILEKEDKIQRFLFFMEARQQKMLKVLCKIAGMSEEETERLENEKEKFK